MPTRPPGLQANPSISFARSVAIRVLSGLALVASVPAAAAVNAVFTDSFDIAHDYAGGKVSGTIWDGVVNQGNAAILNATTTHAGNLTLGVPATSDLGWDASHANAPLIFKTVTGDFDVQVQVIGTPAVNYSVSGLMVRAADPSADSIAGEDFVILSRNFFGTAGFQPRSVDDAVQKDRSVIGFSTVPVFMRLKRTGNVFNAFYSPDGTTWTPAAFYTGTGIVGNSPAAFDLARPDLAGAVQVGLTHGHFNTTASNASARFDNFSLTVTSEEPTIFPLIITPAGSPATGYDLEWKSRAGKAYNLRRSADLVGEISTWNLVKGEIAASPPTNTYHVSPPDLSLFYAVEEIPAPPAPPLQNFGFEDPQIADEGTLVALGMPWTAHNTPVNGSVGNWRPASAAYAGQVPGSTNVGHVFFHTAAPGTPFGISQVLGTVFAANTSYSVTVKVGRPSPYDWPGYQIELRAGGTVIATDDNPLTPTAGTFVTSSVAYTCNAADSALIGQPLELRLLSKGGDPENVGSSPTGWAVDFDDVSFTASSTVIDLATLDAWSAPYRGWHYQPNHVISSNPQIPGYEAFKNTDVPTVYQLPGQPDKWYLSFIGFNNLGYNSFVAESTDLVAWTNPRLAMGFGPAGEFDNGGCVVGAYLYESYDIKAPRLLKRRDDKFWTLYGCYPLQGGYELRPGYEGVASSDGGLAWLRAKNTPILAVQDADRGEWEKDSIYQPWLVEHEGGFYNFYNAANGGTEQTGLAFSANLLDWQRYAGNPVLRVRPGGYDSGFCADPKVFRDGDHWVMFYFGVGNGGAHIMAAFSRDLRNWTSHPEPLYKAGGNPSGLDSQYAHKISLVYRAANDTFYLYYCAVGNQGRGIGLITSKPL